MRTQTTLFRAGMPTANGNVYTREVLEKMVNDLNSGKAEVRDVKKFHRAWIEGDHLMAEFELDGDPCSGCADKSILCTGTKDGLE